MSPRVFSTPALVVVAFVLGTACEERVEPDFCVVRADKADGVIPDCSAVPAFSVREGTAFFVVQRLPSGVDPGKLELHVRVETPCETIERDVAYVAGAAVTTFIAPRGAECSTVVTATVANSEQRVSSQVDPASCGASSAICNAPRDAGQDGAQ